tara:strand:- start:2407 stop:2616 length:210 start_codon:yes stop_codon:yes gene_type:complete
LENIIEIESIKKKLTKKELEVFDMLIKIADKKINKEIGIVKIEIEDLIDPILSDHSSDEEYEVLSDASS